MDNITTAAEVFNAYAQQYQDKFMDLAAYHDTFDLYCDQIKKHGADILEIGCGPGNITRYLLTKRPDFHILGIDIAANMIELARINNPKAHFQLMDARDIGKLGPTYDAIMCGFCLPYLSGEEAAQLIRDASALLKTGGVLYLSTMEDDPAKSGYKPPSSGNGPMLYIHFYQADYLTKILQENGFKIIDVQRKPYPPPDGLITDLIIIARK